MDYLPARNKIIRQINSADTHSLRQRVMWPNKPLSFIMLPNDDEGIHFGVFVDEVLVSVVSLFIKNNNAQFRKFATDENEQRKGYGTLLLAHLIAFGEQKKLAKIWCNARTNKQDFYIKFGFEATNNRFSKAGLSYVVMEKILMVP